MTSTIPFPTHVIGLMSGTSADGVDAAWLHTDGQTVAEPGESLFVPYGDALRRDILGLMQGQGDRAAIAQALTSVHIDAVNALLQKSDRKAALIGFHGQTILHAPERGITVQLGDAALMAHTLGIPVVADFRSNDVKHGGQGAPLVPLYHAARAHGLPKPLMVVNIGGVANVTWMGESGIWNLESGIWNRESGQAQGSEFPDSSFQIPDSLLAFDCGPGNALLDDWVHQHTGARYDKGGALAARGTVDNAALARFLSDPFFQLQPPKSLDRNHFEYVIPAHAGISRSKTTQPAAGDPGMRRDDEIANGAATLTAMTACAIAKACDMVPSKPKQLLITGGGRHNPTLMRMIEHYMNQPRHSREGGNLKITDAEPKIPAYAGMTKIEVRSVDTLGWNGDMLEAEAFAYFAARSVQGLPLSLPSTTGVARPVTGGVFYPAECGGGS